MKLFCNKVFLLIISLYFLLPSVSDAANNKAVLVGISQYEDSEINCLAYADEDVKSFGSILFNIANYNRSDVTMLLNSEARKTTIMKVVVDLVKKSQKEPIDSLIFMYAGHGIPDNIYSHNTNSFLAPYDAMVSQFFHEGSTGTISNETFINRAWLVNQLSAVKAASIVIILDSCYSGAKDFGELFAKNMGFAISYSKAGMSGNERGITIINKSGNIVTEKKIAFIASSKGNQVSTEYKELQHGALSYCIFQYINNVRKATYSSDVVNISVGSLYSNIEHQFDNVQVRGANLSSIHQPVLFPIPNYDDVSKMKLFSVRGIKPTEPDPVYIASAVISRPEPPSLPLAKQEEPKQIAITPPQAAIPTSVEPKITDKAETSVKAVEPPKPKVEPQKPAVAEVPVVKPKQPEPKTEPQKIAVAPLPATIPKQPTPEPQKAIVADVPVMKPKQPEPKVEPPKVAVAPAPATTPKQSVPTPEPQKVVTAEVSVVKPKQSESKIEPQKVVVAPLPATVAKQPKPTTEPIKVVVNDVPIMKPKQPEPEAQKTTITDAPVMNPKQPEPKAEPQKVAVAPAPATTPKQLASKSEPQKAIVADVPVIKPKQPEPKVEPPKVTVAPIVPTLPKQSAPAVETQKVVVASLPTTVAKQATPSAEVQKATVADVPMVKPKQPEPKAEPQKVVVATLPEIKPKQPEPRLGTVEIVTEPGNAEIYVNGEKTGKISNATLRLNEGNHLISFYIKETNYKHTMNVYVKNNTQQKLIVLLRGTIGVEAYSAEKGKEPPVLDVYLDGKHVGNTASKLEINNLVSGTHKLKVKTGDVVKERQVEIRQDSPLLVRYKIIKEASKQTNSPEEGISTVTF